MQKARLPELKRPLAESRLPAGDGDAGSEKCLQKSRGSLPRLAFFGLSLRLRGAHARLLEGGVDPFGRVVDAALRLLADHADRGDAQAEHHGQHDRVFDSGWAVLGPQ